MDATSLIMVALLVVLVFFMFRNKKKRDRQQAELQTALVPGVEVMLTFGVYGTIVSIDEETNTAGVEVSPGTVLKVHRQTLGRVVEPSSPTTWSRPTRPTFSTGARPAPPSTCRSPPTASVPPASGSTPRPPTTTRPAPSRQPSRGHDVASPDHRCAFTTERALP
jgi:preprotein translocase YajC subunit